MFSPRIHLCEIIAVVVSFVSIMDAQFPAKPQGLTTLRSKLQPGVSLEYKQTFICETTPGVRLFSGYVRLPAESLRGIANYNISTFFWYFEARHNASTAPLTIYLAGGPGESSTYSALSSESGPCYANPDGNCTTINPWSFNNHVNVLYIDQPVQTGFSYDTLVNGTYDVLTNTVTPMDESELHTVVANNSYGIGTFASQNPLATTNTTVTSAKALWRFAENWLTSFPEFKTTSKEISVWTNSYGGYWGPAVVAHFQQQLAATPKSSPLHTFTMKTLGLTNACIKSLFVGPSYPEFAFNNTYGVEFIPKLVYEGEVHNMTKAGGCADLIKHCRELGNVGDPNWIGANSTVNEACNLATDYCFGYVAAGLPSLTNRTVFDVAIKVIDGVDPCPVFYLSAQIYLNQPHVLAALGVPLNFTYDSNVTTTDFGSYNSESLTEGTGDSVRKSISDLEYAIANGVNVAMVYRDRDYICNWIGGEATANNVAWGHQKGFQAAGYEKMVTNSTYHGGMTKQFGRLSFTRVFDAGHAVSAYQPETVYRIFMRSMFGTDVATGKRQTGELYTMTGPESSFGRKNVLPKPPSSCMVEGSFQNVNVWAAVQSD